MDLQQKNRLRLEPIQEESEQEDAGKRSKTGEIEEEDFESEAGVETKEVMAEETEEAEEEEEEEEEEDEDDELRVLRPSRPSRSLSNSLSFDSNDEAAPPKQIFKFKWQKHTQRKPPVRKKENRKRPKKESLVAEPFPEWLVELMFNIEEATTHQLVVE